MLPILSLLIPLVVALSIFYWSLKLGITPAPSTFEQTRAIVKRVEGQQVFDVGSGFGTLAIAIARHCPSCRVTGIERSPVPYLAARLLKLLFRLSNVQFVKADFHKYDVSRADTIVCYLFPRGMQELQGKLERELKPGSVVISNTFAVPGWPAKEVLQLSDVFRTKIYIYVR